MKKLIVLLLAVGLLASCETVKVFSDYDKTEDFSQYKTLEYYGWAKNSDKVLNRFDKERIENAVAAEFDKRGIKVVEDDGDIIVSLYILTEVKTQRTASTTHLGGYGGYWGYGPGWGWGGGSSYTSFNEYDYTVGTLAISVFDVKEKKLIWEGIGTGTVDENPDTRDKRVPQSVAKIMSKYPVKPIK